MFSWHAPPRQSRAKIQAPAQRLHARFWIEDDMGLFCKTNNESAYCN
jgi:hypothetical protein